MVRNTRIANPRWLTTAILEKWKNGEKIDISLQRFDRFRPNLASITQLEPLMLSDRLKFQILKIKDGGGAILKTRKITIYRQRLDLLPRNLARWRSLTLLTIPTAAMSMQPIYAIMNLSTDSLECVGCFTYVIFLFLLSFCVIWAIYVWLCFQMIIIQ